MNKRFEKFSFAIAEIAATQGEFSKLNTKKLNPATAVGNRVFTVSPFVRRT